MSVALARHGDFAPRRGLFLLCGLFFLCLMALSALGGESRADSDCTHLDALDTPGKLTWPALRLRILPDPERRLSFAEVSALPLTAFAPTGNPVAPGYHDGRYWLRFCLKRDKDTAPASWVLSVLPPYLTHVDLHEHTPDGWKTRRLGAALPQEEERGYRGAAFLIHLEEAQTAYEYLLLIDSRTTTAADITLLPPNDMARLIGAEYMLFGFYLGMMLLVMVINALFWYRLRARVHLYYALAMLATAIFSAATNGFLAQFVLPTHPELVRVIVSMSFAGGALTLSLFLMHAFRMRLYYRRIYQLSRLFMVGYFVSFILPAIGEPILGAHLTAKLVIIHLPLALLVVTHALLRHRSVRFYGLALFPLILSLVLLILRNHGVPLALPMLDTLPMIAALVHLVLLNAALAHTAWRSEQKRHRAQANALRAAQQAELELEWRVIERTRQLDESNARLQLEIGERELAQRQLEAALAAERDALRTQRQFFSMVSHEFRTPLCTIDGAAQNLALLLAPEHPERLERVTSIRRNVGRLVNLVDECLSQERLDAPQNEEHTQHIELSALLREKYTQNTKAPRIRLILPDDPVPVDGDPQLLRIVLSSLTDNALKYSPVDSPVEVRLHRDTDRLCIDVRDHGPGIAPEEQERIFERFYRAQSGLDQPGTGLGLHLARELMRRHGGDVILVQSNPQGSVFRIQLPARRHLSAEDTEGTRV